MQTFTTHDREKPCTEDISALNLAAVRLMTFQVIKQPL